MVIWSYGEPCQLSTPACATLELELEHWSIDCLHNGYLPYSGSNVARFKARSTIRHMQARSELVYPC